MRFLAVLPLFLPCLAASQDTATPELRNAIYVHPVQMVAMAVTSAVKPADYSAIWLQADYERYLVPVLSAVVGIQYFTQYPHSHYSNDANLGYFDVVAGARYYPGRHSSGFYIQNQLDYMRVFASSDDDDVEFWNASWNRFGITAVLGVNGKWDRISLDWNIGASVLTPVDGKIAERNKKTGEVEMTNLDNKALVTQFLTSTLVPSTAFSVGYRF
jgi:hypothetical protein